jgi:predicted TIM-barrel fold metal-dependent hydrolase
MGRAITAPPAFREPGPRIELMDELGIDRALMWPTLASLVEERLRDDPHAIHAVIHSLNAWMYEHWTFNFENRIFPSPIITLPIVEKAIDELEWVRERGAKLILVRPAPVPGLDGPRSFALPEFDPFWERVQEAGILVEGISDAEFTPFAGVSGFALISGSGNRPIFDAMSSIVGHGLCTRFPDLRFAPVENGTGWVRPLLSAMEHAYFLHPQAFEEHPVEAFKRCVAVHPFHENDPKALADLVGVDNVIFGSDYPHPEGMADPITFVDRLDGMDAESKAKIMGGNLARLLRLDDPVKVA